MTEAYLRPCPACSRHVRVSEGACPFCSVALDASFRAAPAPIGPSARLSRAALFAFSAGTAVLAPVVAIDCSTTSEPLYGGSAIAPYGAEPFPEGGYGVETDGGGRVAPDVSVGSPDASDASLATSRARTGATRPSRSRTPLRTTARRRDRALVPRTDRATLRRTTRTATPGARGARRETRLKRERYEQAGWACDRAASSASPVRPAVATACRGA